MDYKNLYLEAIQALENIQNIGAERPEEDLTEEMFGIANNALVSLAKEDLLHIPYLVPTKS
jgi:hypothetical protein